MILSRRLRIPWHRKLLKKVTLHNTYIGDIAVESGCYLHLRHGYEHETLLLHEHEVSTTQLKVTDLGNLDRLVHDRLWHLLINLDKASEDATCPHINPIHHLLQVQVQFCTAFLYVVVVLERKIGFWW